MNGQITMIGVHIYIYIYIFTSFMSLSIHSMIHETDKHQDSTF